MTLNLRAHHIFCVPFLDHLFSDRGEAFNKVEDMIKKVMLSDDNEMLVKVTEGVDELCRECLLCKDDRCESPKGDETEVRKWDAIILKGLGMEIGKILKLADIQSIISEKAPLDLCFRCQWRKDCRMGRKTGGS